MSRLTRAIPEATTGANVFISRPIELPNREATMRTYLAKIVKSTSIPRDVFLTVVGAMLGLAISHLYYVKSVSDMRADAEEKNRINQLILLGIENIGSMNYVRDGSGNVTGVEIRLHGRGQAQASGSAMPTVTSPDQTQ